MRVDREHRQAAGGGVERDAGAGDAEADDEHVDGLADGRLEVRGAAGGGRGGR